MVDQGAHVAYVPILKWRKGEKVALSKLDMGARAKVIPLVELVNDEGDNPEDLTRDIRSHWGSTVYMDVYYRPRDFAYRALDNIINHFDGLDVIPVVRLDSPPLLLDSFKNVAARYKNGVAVRIVVDTRNEFKLLQQEVDLILGQLALAEDSADLIIDFGHLEDIKGYESTLRQLASNLRLSAWRRIIIAAGTFPADLTDFRPNGENLLARNEWTLWKAHKEALRRESIYSDYTVRYAPYIQRNTAGSVSARYTLDDNYQVFRGKQDDKSFKYLVHALNIRTLYGDNFSHNFSWGDEFIDAKAKQLEECLKNGEDPETHEGFTPGGPADWVAASVNHHICVVLKDS